MNEIHETDQQTWNSRWETNTTPWDTSAPHLALTRTLDSAGTQGIPDFPRHGKALVPGCGTGYDVYLFAQRGMDASGIDVAPLAVAEAGRWLDAQSPVLKNARVSVGDFFNLPRPQGGYDLFYDYTFLCALPPQLRTQWAQTYTRLASPSALLITLQYPIDANRTRGPPYAVSPDLYEGLLGGEWEQVWSRGVVGDERRTRYGSDEVEPEGRERIAIWRRR